ncbi:helix-turn-helix domain-containing protein [Streptomyces sp. NPDC058701]|uniref:helix-turn-helix domain-containing protein n=1 Tax=Streptomyces sp. NPDC058701 TaxID=3346608 RepID=UPI003669E245
MRHGSVRLCPEPWLSGPVRRPRAHHRSSHGRPAQGAADGGRAPRHTAPQACRTDARRPGGARLRHGARPPGAGAAGPGRDCHAGRPARGLHERTTLRRAFLDEGTTWRAALEQVRDRRVRDLLETTGLPLEAIARDVGFSGAAALVRAFRRRHGRPPGAHRSAANPWRTEGASE